MNNPTSKILVVDDSEDNRTILWHYLSLEGHDATLAANGREAMDLLAENTFDLILLDIMMPIMNGFEFLAAVKAFPGCAIFVSNEVGLGIVPENRLAREFRDCVGRLHQDLAGICSGVTLVVAGRPLQLRTNCSSGDPVLRFEFSEVGGNFVRQVNFPVHRAANASSILPIDLQNRLTAEGIDLQAILGSHVDGAAGLVLDLESQRGNLRIQLIR